MKDIDILKKTIQKYKNIMIQKKFFSKKNSVAYVILDDKPRIIKWFAPGFKIQMQNEYKILKQASPSLNMPKIYGKDEKNNIIIMSYIPGKNLCDLINDDNTSFDNKNKLLFELANWLKSFHQHYKSEDEYIIRGDSILRNFIFTDKIWGVDFEESRFGEIDEDIATICSSILTTDPKYTDEKYLLCKNFLEYYSKSYLLKYKKIRKEISYSILKTNIQRGINISKKDSEEIVDNIFYKINAI